MPAARAILWVAESLRSDTPDRIDLPNFSSLAGDSAYFKRCVMTFPTRIQRDPVFGTVISNLSIVTGTVLWDRRQTLAEALAGRGKSVHVTAFPSYKTCDAGFSRSFFKNYPDMILAFKCFEWIEELDPVLAVVHPQDLMNGAAQKNIPPGTDIFSPGSVYRDLARRQDEALGFFVSQLQRVKKWEDTLFVVVGDHGVSLSGAHPPLDPDCWFSPLLLHGPGIAAGAAFDLAECVDIAPTVCRLLGAAPPRGTTGRALGEALLEPGDAPVSGEPKLLRLHELCKEFAERLQSAALAEEEKGRLKAEFHGDEGYPGWGRFESMDALLEHNRRVLDRLKAAR